MSLLVDINVVLWAVDWPRRISPVALVRLSDETQCSHVFAASIWEVLIAAGLGRAGFGILASHRRPPRRQL